MRHFTFNNPTFAALAAIGCISSVFAVRPVIPDEVFDKATKEDIEQFHEYFPLSTAELHTEFNNIKASYGKDFQTHWQKDIKDVNILNKFYDITKLVGSKPEICNTNADDPMCLRYLLNLLDSSVDRQIIFAKIQAEGGSIGGGTAPPPRPEPPRPDGGVNVHGVMVHRDLMASLNLTDDDKTSRGAKVNLGLEDADVAKIRIKSDVDKILAKGNTFLAFINDPANNELKTALKNNTDVPAPLDAAHKKFVNIVKDLKYLTELKKTLPEQLPTAAILDKYFGVKADECSAEVLDYIEQRYLYEAGDGDTKIAATSTAFLQAANDYGANNLTNGNAKAEYIRDIYNALNIIRPNDTLLGTIKPKLKQNVVDADLKKLIDDYAHMYCDDIAFKKVAKDEKVSLEPPAGGLRRGRRDGGAGGAGGAGGDGGDGGGNGGDGGDGGDGGGDGGNGGGGVDDTLLESHKIAGIKLSAIFRDDATSEKYAILFSSADFDVVTKTSKKAMICRPEFKDKVTYSESVKKIFQVCPPRGDA